VPSRQTPGDHPPPSPRSLATDIKYGSLLEVDETLKKLRLSGPKAGDAMLVEEVGPEEIAGVVSKWTGERECERARATGAAAAAAADGERTCLPAADLRSAHSRCCARATRVTPHA
jgi:hypothetical protein